MYVCCAEECCGNKKPKVCPDEQLRTVTAEMFENGWKVVTGLNPMPNAPPAKLQSLSEKATKGVCIYFYLA